MRFSTAALATVAAVVPIVSAHDSMLPKIRGLDMRDLKARNLMDNIRARAALLGSQDAHAHEKRGGVKPRQGGTDGQCGPGFGSCAAGYCCSGAGCKLMGWSPRPNIH